MTYTSKKNIAFDWLQMTDGERIANNLPIVKTKFISFLGLRRKTFTQWEVEFYDPKNVYARSHPMMGKPVEDEPEYDSDAWLRGRTQEADISLMKSCASGNAQALKLFNQLINRLVEKQEVTHKLDGNFIAREVIRARRELEDSGMAQVPDESAILPGKLRLSSGQKQNKNS